jgi:polysaccharide export outer membrane protein
MGEARRAKTHLRSRSAAPVWACAGALVATLALAGCHPTGSTAYSWPFSSKGASEAEALPAPLTGSTVGSSTGSKSRLVSGQAGDDADGPSFVGPTLSGEKLPPPMPPDAQFERLPPDTNIPAFWGPLSPTQVVPAGIQPIGPAMSDEVNWVSPAHILCAGDELDIKFPHRPTFSETVMVRQDGKITLPLIGDVMAAGQTPMQLQQQLVESYRALEYNASSGLKKEYRIAVNDKLEIRFQEPPGYSELVTVRPDGKISLPLVKTVVAEGKTPEELEAELAGRYAAYLKAPDLVVIVREFTSDRVYIDGKLSRGGLKDIDDVVVLTRAFDRMVFVSGEVGSPGFVRYRSPMTVMQTIMAAGGNRRTADMQRVIVIRRGPTEQPVVVSLNLSGDWQGAAMNDIPLNPFDVILVPKSGIAKFTDMLEMYIYQVIPMTRNTSFSYFMSNNGGSTSILTFR